MKNLQLARVVIFVSAICTIAKNVYLNGDAVQLAGSIKKNFEELGV